MIDITLSAHATETIDRVAPLPFWQCIKQDAIAHIPPEVRVMSRSRSLVTYLRIFLLASGFHLSLLYRLSYTAHMKFGILGKIVAQLLFWVRRHWYTCAIASTARIAGGVIFPHPQGIVIGAEATVGERTWIFQNVTIGGIPGKVGLPHIGNDCRIYTGAVIVGPIEIGEGVIIGANAVVAKSISAHLLVKPTPTVMVALTSD
jgi:serine O-acetyltransferase